MNFQVTVLKILASYPQGFATLAEVKRDMAILATSGRDWAERTKRLAARVPNLDIFSQALVERRDGGWRITEKGNAILELMEQRPPIAETPEATRAEEPPSPVSNAAPTKPSFKLNRHSPGRRMRRRARSIIGKAAGRSSALS